MRPWGREDLGRFARDYFSDRRIIVVSNREPYVHQWVGGRVECLPPASGMAAAIGPILRAAGGTWVAHGSGSADRRTVDRNDHVAVPPDNPSYVLRRVWLTKEQEAGYYYGLSNEGLWPLCHVAFTRPVFRQEDWRRYREVNEVFARAVLEETGGERSLVFIQDYHLALLPRLLKERDPNLLVAQFWHIPWPNREVFRVFPWSEELLDGLLGNDLIGFHLRYHCQNFLETLDQGLECRVDQERSEAVRGGKATAVRCFPISIDFESQSTEAASPAVTGEMDRWRRELGLSGGEVVGIGLDRLDYTKGIPEKLKAVDRFLEQNPSYVGRMVFVQVVVPSRSRIPTYNALSEEVTRLAEEVNWRWSTDSWRPVALLRNYEGSVRMMALHRLADFCLVTPLHDGMNLVAKEFVASRFDEDGVLILSNFAGSARDLEEALLVNPFSVEETAGAILKALDMLPEERRKRMQRLRETVSYRNVYWWAGKVLRSLAAREIPAQVERWETTLP
ncbi:MAG: trehalose-6-phosphate synthase [Bryobacterales bacterium]|nr:trehalose-6-phosphate synthase [Bryobacterales bacterium]